MWEELPGGCPATTLTSSSRTTPTGEGIIRAQRVASSATPLLHAPCLLHCLLGLQGAVSSTLWPWRPGGMLHTLHSLHLWPAKSGRMLMAHKLAVARLWPAANLLCKVGLQPDLPHCSRIHPFAQIMSGERVLSHGPKQLAIVMQASGGRYEGCGRGADAHGAAVAGVRRLRCDPSASKAKQSNGQPTSHSRVWKFLSDAHAGQRRAW